MTAKEKPKRPRLSIIPARAVTDPNISAQALRVLALLGRHTDDEGWCTRSQVRMAQELAVSRGTIQNSLDELTPAYLERREENRPNVRPEPGRHPHCSYSYRVKLDLEDEVSPGASQLAPTSASPLAGGANHDQHGVPTSLAPLTERPLVNEPLGNSLPDGETETVASLGKGQPERFEEFKSAVADTWPGGFPNDNDTAARKAWERVTRTHSADLVIACARTHGGVKTKAQASRRHGKEMVRLPANWLKDGDWEGYVRQIDAGEAAARDTALRMGRVQASIGATLMKFMRENLGKPDSWIAALEGIVFEAGPPPLLTAGPAQCRMLENNIFALQRELGEDLQIIPISSGRKSA